MTCPDPETLAAMAEQCLDPGNRELLLDHVAGCDDCRHVLLILGGLKPAAIPVPGRFRPWIAWAAAAVLVISVAAVLFLGRRGDDPSTARTPPVPEAPRRDPEAPKPAPEVVPPKPESSPKTPEPKKTPAPEVPDPAPLPEPPVKPVLEKPEPPKDPAPVKPPPAPEPVKPATVTFVAVLDRLGRDVVVLRGAAPAPAQTCPELRDRQGLASLGARSVVVLGHAHQN